MNGIAIITGRRPIMSERPAVAKLPIVAEMPSVPISQLCSVVDVAAHLREVERHERPGDHQVGDQHDAHHHADPDVADLQRLPDRRDVAADAAAVRVRGRRGGRVHRGHRLGFLVLRLLNVNQISAAQIRPGTPAM